MSKNLEVCYDRLLRNIDKIFNSSGLSDEEKIELLTNASDGIRDKAIEIDSRCD